MITRITKSIPAEDTVSHPYEKTFAEAWANPRYTRFEAPPLDVNAALAAEFELDEPFTYTRTHLWDMEVRKAWRPDLYIPVIRNPATVRAWGEDPTFTRVSEQALWLEPGAYGVVIERVHLNHEAQVVTFLGAAEAVDERGVRHVAGTGQPLFHVEHGTAGTEERPLNTWRMVSLTEEPDPRLEAEMSRWWGKVPPFVEYHVREVLGVGLRRRTQP